MKKKIRKLKFSENVRAYLGKLRDEKMTELNEARDEIITHIHTHTYTWLGAEQGTPFIELFVCFPFVEKTLFREVK